MHHQAVDRNTCSFPASFCTRASLYSPEDLPSVGSRWRDALKTRRSGVPNAAQISQSLAKVHFVRLHECIHSHAHPSSAVVVRTQSRGNTGRRFQKVVKLITPTGLVGSKYNVVGRWGLAFNSNRDRLNSSSGYCDHRQSAVYYPSGAASPLDVRP